MDRRAILLAAVSTARACAAPPDDPIETERQALGDDGPVCVPVIPEELRAISPSGTIDHRRPTFVWHSPEPERRKYLQVVSTDSGARVLEARIPSGTWYTAEGDLPEGIELRWTVSSSPCSSRGASATFAIQVPPTPEPPGHGGQCFPGLRECEAVCRGVCERRILCGGASAHKCFE